MLRSVCISSRGGFVLFSADFEGNGKNIHSISGLLTALTDISKRSVGCPVSYVLMKNLAITIVQSEETGIKVILFHDAAYFRVLAHRIATEIMKAFTERFPPSTYNGNDSSIFRHFNSSLGPAIRNASFFILHSLIERLRGAIQFAVVLIDGDAAFTYPSNANSLSVAANSQALQFSLSEIAGITDDQPYELIIEGVQIFTHVVLFGTAVVFLQIRADYHSTKVVADLTETLDMLRLCFQTSEGLMA